MQRKENMAEEQHAMNATHITHATTVAAALDGVVVLELGYRVAAGACGSLLAQLGATVIAIEPSVACEPVDKWCGRPQFLAGKMSFAPDMDKTEDRALLAALIRQADVILRSSDRDPPELSAMLFKPGGRQVVCDLTAFGSNGPLAGKGWSDVEMQAMTGILYTTGLADGPPVPVLIPIIEYLTATQAAGAVLAALRAARISGVGQGIDMAMYDCGFAAMSSFFARLLSEDAGMSALPPARLGNLHTLSAPWNVYRAVDGWLMICTGSHVQWQRLCELMGRPELGDDPRYADSACRVAHVAEVDAAVQAWVGAHSVAHCVAALREASVPGGPITPVDQYPREENLDYRDMIRRLGGAREDDVFTPGSPLRMTRTPGKALTEVPARDADRQQVIALLQGKRTQGEPPRSRTPCLPLKGIRVLEIGHYTTAPVGARSLAALGADVIKIEPPGGEAARGWEPMHQGQSVFYTVSNSDKRDIVIDLNDEEDRYCLRRLLATADVLIENLKPGTLSKFGLSPQAIADINPKLVYCAISGFGADSLYAGRPAFDSVVQGMSGLMSLVTSRGTPLKTGISYADVVGAGMAVVGVLAALEYRHRSGLGQFIDLSMQDVVAWATQLAWNGHAQAAVEHRIVRDTDGDVVLYGESDVRRPHSKGAAVRTPAEVLACAQTAARGLRCVALDERGRWPALAVPLRLLGTPLKVLRPGPALGQHNDVILGPLRGASNDATKTGFQRPAQQTNKQTGYIMNYENIQTESDGAALIITLHRPDKRNALSQQTMDEISDAVRKADTDAAVRGIVLTGGDRFFSAGADLNEALQVKSVMGGDAFFGRANRLCELLEGLTKPVIAAIEGFCITGGLEVAMACDIRVGAKGSSYAITSSRIGTVAGFGGTQRLPRLVGSDNALDILFSAEPVDAEHAHRIGLITRLVEKGDALAEAKRMIAVYEKRGPISLAFAKRAVHRGMQMDLYSGIDLEYALVTSIYSTEDKQEGVSAFLEKREACFTGR